MTIEEWLKLSLQYGSTGLIVVALAFGVLTNRIYFRRDIDDRDKLWQARVDAVIEDRDRAIRSADNATTIAKDSAEKLTEVLTLVRAYLPGLRA